MKKLITTIFTFSTLISFAQISYGVKGGYLLSGLKIGDQQIENKSYFYIGGFVEKRVNEKFSLQGEILYTEPGGKQNYELYRIVGDQVIVEGTETATFKFPQIQVPLIAKYYIVEKFSLGLGLNFGINLNPTIENYYLFPNPIESSVAQEDIKTLNLFPLLNVEYQLSKNFFVDARYNSNFFKVNSSSLDKKIAMAQIGLGYKF
jgi:hypothetical protein